MIAPPSPPLLLPSRESHGHKGSYGRVLLVGGSRGMSGAVALSAMASLRSGSGLVSVFVPDRCLETVAGFDPCLMTIAAPDTDQGHFALGAADMLKDRLKGIDAIGIGPGMGTGPGSEAIVRLFALLEEMPRVFDADALNIMAGDNGIGENGIAFRGPVVLTPHPGELQRLTGAPAGDREMQIEAATKLAQRLGVTVVLKGANTLVTDGQSRWFNPTGNPGMATGGTGDCLTGIIASLLGQHLEPFAAAKLGTYAHGLAGDLAAVSLGQPGMTATDLLGHLPAAIRTVIAPD